MGSVSSLIPSGISAPSEETRHTFTNRNFVYFPFVLSHPGRQSLSVYIILSLRNQLECDKIRCFLVLLFRSFDTLQEITLPGQGSGLCSKVHVLLMRTHYTQTHCGLATHFSLNFEVLPTFTKLGIQFEIMLRNCTGLLRLDMIRFIQHSLCLWESPQLLVSRLGSCY